MIWGRENHISAGSTSKRKQRTVTGFGALFERERDGGRGHNDEKAMRKGVLGEKGELES